MVSSCQRWGRQVLFLNEDEEVEEILYFPLDQNNFCLLRRSY